MPSTHERRLTLGFDGPYVSHIAQTGIVNGHGTYSFLIESIYTVPRLFLLRTPTSTATTSTIAMGQRQQAFIIAKVKPRGSTQARYWCIAAYHHQWCYGTLAVWAAHRLLTLVKQPENAEIIREELRSIDGKYEVVKQRLATPSIPCPFIATLLGTSWDVGLSSEDVYASGISLSYYLLDANMGSWDGRKSVV